MRQPLVGRVGLYAAGGDHLGRPVAFGGCAALPVLLGVLGGFRISSFIFIYGLAIRFSPLTLVM